MTEIRHIVFDIGKVLVHYDPDIPFSRLIPDAGERKWFFDNVCTSAWNLEQDRGRTWEEAEALLIAEHPGHAENIRNFRRYWHEMAPHAYEDSVALLENLIDDGRDVTLLTNWASDTFREARARFPFLEKPRGVTVSGDIGLIKPDRAIYDHHVASFGLDPAASLFIDDSQKNVDGAKAAGWRAVLFTDAPTLKADLERLGIVA
ncbi:MULTISPECIES: HAD family phosphatase [unclassified Mesorhizobium]|uniref:HAD family hydrolase n=1 Tax=unclassified Mesorhizobium TaxID=325217 RepID=UPI000FE3AF9C|nr:MULTISPECIES: HAD family phosphatase [unclassified Mesorhizobium]MDG4893825.1 HAD family phosphatase [Mesorhizobium sp. WSM4976]RWH70267.1 MAG: HAD family phosphatase [Mesorhizobium sp.]RWL23647.1 MAG: HAD family phosphatase [Mesorhizobium sp.]RWL25739.1 MAG: HAD family phosphatase [Mesorhizobium sp.]RWL34727.1 MAG: HAD family phosphatase [Mesorhizobium sp.]